MEESKIVEFESREYQIELFELAVEKNLILYLPTGSGKTFIATLLIKHLGNSPDTLFTPISSGGKRTFFLVNTVALVDQQGNQIRNQTTFNVGTYYGDMGVDLWERTTWLSEIDNNQVLVMTAQIFLDLVLSDTISVKNTNLLIFDECHRAVSNHPMRQIMKTFKDIPSNEQPRVLGLTATLLNGNIKPEKVEEEIRTLEKTFMAQIATSINEAMVEMYSTNPKESKVDYHKNETSNHCYRFRNKVLDGCKDLAERVKFDEEPKIATESQPKRTKRMDSGERKVNKRMKNLIEDIKVNMDDLGVFGGTFAALAHLVQVQQMIPNCQLATSKLLFQSISADCVLLRQYFQKEMTSNDQTFNDKEAMLRYSSDKVAKLFQIVKKVNPNDSAIIFVRRRFTAKILYYILKTAAANDPRLKDIKCSFVVGYNIGNPFKDTRENYLQRSHNKRIMNQFNQGELNVLISSNVLEEGVDITNCNFVIMFDDLIDFRSYIQSKGRARDKDSNYIIMTCYSDPTFDSKYQQFQNLEYVLQKVLYGGKSKLRCSPTKDEVESSLFMETPGLETYRPSGPSGPSVTAISAISLVNRYFVSLKSDKFTKITPIWWLQTEGMRYKCFLQLPMESKVRGLIEGTWQDTKEDAKRSVAIEACKKLYMSGELDKTHLLPVSVNDVLSSTLEFTPNKDDSEVFEEAVGGKTIRVGTKKNKRSCVKKWPNCLSGCRPLPNKPLFLHVLHIVPVYSPPVDNHRLQVLHETLTQPNNFALLSSKELPKLASFPLYMSTGELQGTIQDAIPITLNENELENISEFHRHIFDDVLGVAKTFMIRDFSNTQNAYLIAPVLNGTFQNVSIDWSIIEEIKRPFPSTDVQPSQEERSVIEITEANYLGKVVSPWYRTVPAQKYLVTKVCYDKSENSAFPTETYATYKEYFIDKYKIKPLIKNQPLLEVRAFSSNMKSTKPRAITKDLKRKNKDENEDFEVWLLGEFCVVYPLSGKYWMKALLLPSMLHRISQLCQAEQLRCTIAQNTGIGKLKLLPGEEWKKLQDDASLLSNNSSPAKQQALTPLKTLTKNFTTLKPSFDIWGEEEEPLDIERYMDTASVFDIVNYGYFIEKPLLGVASTRSEVLPHMLANKRQRPVLKMVDPPPLMMLQNDTSGIGPQQTEIMQALTTAGSNDFVSCERLETLGDSFLKFAISLTLFETQQDMQEGFLTYIKGIIVGNKNLFYCGKKKSLDSILEAHHFSPNEDWVPPGFCVEHTIQDVLHSAKLQPSCLYKAVIPAEERIAGKLSGSTNALFNDILLAAEDVVQPQTWNFINVLALLDKNISDAVEAILGVYLKSTGIFGALAVMNWFQVTNPLLSTPQVFTQCKTAMRGSGNPNTHLLLPHLLERRIGYKFRDRSFLLQALSHPSYSRNNITMSYQRLEFLGDALIDFLITVHIYEKCVTLSPGDLTDLRSALVNNITLACITVRNDLHKFLLYSSTKLNECMMRFARHQQDRDDVVDDDILFLFEEGEVNIAEAVDVPKALGDIFEALVGAIYLDSGKDINVVWKIVYNLMKSEIEKFHKDVPKNHVRMLYESKCNPEFSASLLTNGVVMVKVNIIHKGCQMQFNGFGDNKSEAKRAASKHALRFIRNATD